MENVGGSNHEHAFVTDFFATASPGFWIAFVAWLTASLALGYEILSHAIALVHGGHGG